MVYFKMKFVDVFQNILGSSGNLFECLREKCKTPSAVLQAHPGTNKWMLSLKPFPHSNS